MEQSAEIQLIETDVGPELAEMIRRYPLPEGVPDADMNQAELAGALNVTVNTIGKWCDREDFPVAQRGGMGSAYKLRLSHCYAWRQADLARDAREREHNRRAQELLQASFLGLHVDEPEARLTAEQRKKLAEADFAFNRAKQLRRQLVSLSDLVEMLDNVMGIIRNGIEALPDRLERELALKPEQVALVQRATADTLARAVAEIEAAELSERDIADVEPQEQLVI